MLPTLRPGDLVLSRRPWRRRLPPLGRLVVVRDPDGSGRVLVKRVVALGARGFSVGSDAPDHARDSRRFGELAPSALLGLVVAVWPRPGSRG